MPPTNLNTSENIKWSNAKVVVFLNNEHLLFPVISTPDGAWPMVDQPNFLYYPSDFGMDRLPDALSWISIPIAETILETLAVAEDQGRVFFAPPRSLMTMRTISWDTQSEHLQIFQRVLAKIRQMGVDVPEWAFNPDDFSCNAAYWQWEAFRVLMRTFTSSGELVIIT